MYTFNSILNIAFKNRSVMQEMDSQNSNVFFFFFFFLRGGGEGVQESVLYRPRCCGQPDVLSPSVLRPRVIVHRVVHNTLGDSFDYCPQRREIHVLVY